MENNGQDIPQPVNLVEGTVVPDKPVTFDFPEAMRRIIDKKVVRKLEWPNEDYGLLQGGWLTIFTKGEFHKWLVNDGDLEGTDYVQVN